MKGLNNKEKLILVSIEKVGTELEMLIYLVSGLILACMGIIIIFVSVYFLSIILLVILTIICTGSIVFIFMAIKDMYIIKHYNTRIDELLKLIGEPKLVIK